MQEAMPDEKRLTAVVRGYVQGVGFRAYVRRQALGLGLVGYVRNMPDGAVEVIAEGHPLCLENLREVIREGPLGSRVTDIAEDITPAEGGYDGFEIGY